MERSPEARRWLADAAARRIRAAAPELVYAEAGQALIGYVRAGTLGMAGAIERLEHFARLPLEVLRLATLVPAALPVADEFGLSLYDACYAAAAIARHAILVTADQDLAAAYPRSVLLA